ncbi:FHA domain-containing protein [Frondihabitans sp. 4ASC-45]|uniref:FHA domain-containing protein n=1 Tax=Frondihabitans sp. 4ASC-45 TaxID=3111636 RepID=UPI003C20568B
MIPLLLTFSDGQTLEASGSVVVGRNPHLHQLASELDEGPVDLVTLVDPLKSVSRVHLAFGTFDGVPWVLDADSGNGTRLIYPDGSAFALDSGVRYELDPGSRVEFGPFSALVG